MKKRLARRMYVKPKTDILAAALLPNYTVDDLAKSSSISRTMIYSWLKQQASVSEEFYTKVYRGDGNGVKKVTYEKFFFVEGVINIQQFFSCH